MNGEEVITAPPVNKDAGEQGHCDAGADEPGANGRSPNSASRTGGPPRPGARVDSRKAAWIPCIWACGVGRIPWMSGKSLS